MFKCELIIGTTASGKSAYAIEEARKSNGVVLSIDSLAVYSQLNLGTAKPPKDIFDEIPHYCINIADIDRPFSAMDFKRVALKTIKEIKERECPLFLTAGSFFYLKALLTEATPVPQTDPEIEKNIRSRIETEGLDALYSELKSIDPKSALKIHPHDRYRIIRALSIFTQTSIPLSRFVSNSNEPAKKPEWLGKVTLLPSDKISVEERIKIRTGEMLKMGLVEEVESLLKNGYNETLRPLQSVGYKEVIGYLSGRIKKEELPELINRSTNKLAKRQRTWIRNGFSSILN